MHYVTTAYPPSCNEDPARDTAPQLPQRRYCRCILLLVLGGAAACFASTFCLTVAMMIVGAELGVHEHQREMGIAPRLFSRYGPSSEATPPPLAAPIPPPRRDSAAQEGALPAAPLSLLLKVRDAHKGNAVMPKVETLQDLRRELPHWFRDSGEVQVEVALSEVANAVIHLLKEKNQSA
jgi:hypothetical protein